MLEWKTGRGYSFYIETPIGVIRISPEETPRKESPMPPYCVTLPDGRRLKARSDDLEFMKGTAERFLVKVRNDLEKFLSK